MLFQSRLGLLVEEEEEFDFLDEEELEFLEDDEITYLQLAQQAIESLYNSPEHRKNILNKNYVFGVSGAALEKTKDGFFLLVTQNFYNNWTF